MYENLEILLITVAGCLLNNRFDSRKSDVTAGTKSAKIHRSKGNGIGAGNNNRIRVTPKM